MEGQWRGATGTSTPTSEALLFLIRTFIFIFLMFCSSAVTFENRLMDLLCTPFQSMESHLTASCVLPDWAILFSTESCGFTATASALASSKEQVTISKVGLHD
jgi:hypothetical protein